MVAESAGQVSFAVQRARDDESRKIYGYCLEVLGDELPPDYRLWLASMAKGDRPADTQDIRIDDIPFKTGELVVVDPDCPYCAKAVQAAVDQRATTLRAVRDALRKEMGKPLKRDGQPALRTRIMLLFEKGGEFEVKDE